MKFITVFYIFIFSTLPIFSGEQKSNNNIWFTGGLKTYIGLASTDCACMDEDPICDHQKLDNSIPFSIKFSKKLYKNLSFYTDLTMIYQTIELDSGVWDEIYFVPQIGLIWGTTFYFGATLGYPLLLDTGVVDFNTSIVNIIFGAKIFSDGMFLAFDIKNSIFSTYGGGRRDDGLELSFDLGFGFIF